MTDSAIHAFCAKQRELLQLELQSENVQDDDKTKNNIDETTRSHVLHQLDAVDVSVGLYGRTVVELGVADGKLLPAHRFTTGDEVEIRSKTASTRSSSDRLMGGVVSQVTEHHVSVALFSKPEKGKQKKADKNDDNDNDDDDNLLGAPPYSILPKSSLEVHKKLMIALDELEQHGVDHPVAGAVVKALFDAKSMPQIPPPPSSSNNNGKKMLDASQQEAVAFALQPQRPLALLHGPPGSGKTTTVVELIRQAVFQHKYRVLVTAPSNVAVDNVLSRLVSSSSTSGSNKKQSSLRVVRLGHPARLQTDILPYSLEALVQRAEGTEIVADVRKELQGFLRVASNPRARYADKVAARREIRLLRKEVRAREQGVVQDLLQTAQVVLATCVGAGNRKLLSSLQKKQHFDLVIVDEAAQALEAACWIPALRGKRLVLAGDHFQLPPTIKCHNPRVQTGLGRTMFERVMDLYKSDEEQVSRMLLVQYRMHQSIADWASEALYGGKLTTHESVGGRLLAKLEGVVVQTEDDSDVAETPLLLIDTAGCAMPESTNAVGSRYNEGEAELVGQHVRKLLDLGVQQQQIAVITPYNGQVEILRTALLSDYPKLEIRTVDGFQGGEREAVVLSLVRSSEDHRSAGIGFLRDDRRLNVAVTRAKRHCCLICNSETVSKSSFVKNLISWIEEHGEVRSALECLEGTNEVQMNSDLLQAQIELDKIMAAEEKAKQQAKKVEETEKRQALLEKVRSFVAAAEPGDEMPLSTELSKGDRHAVHELAEKLDVGHCSSGVEGVDRRIVISIPLVDEVVVPAEATSTVVVDNGGNGDKGNDSEEEEEEDRPNSTKLTFSALQEADDDSDGEKEDNSKTEHTIETEKKQPSLADLAKERRAREAQRRQEAHRDAAGNATKKKKKKKKPKGQRLGGAKKPQEEVDEGLDELDDMAFLDAQIEKVQTSHGRTISAKGSNYKTVMNGILLSKPAPAERKRDARASAALQSKLQDAQKGRRAKGKKKK